ncbi:distal membrane-arm assembly complex protein 2 [Pyxicephalus adspersus]
MAAPWMLRTLRLRPSIGYVFTRHSSSSSVSDPKKKIFKFLGKYFHDINAIMKWKIKWKNWRLETINKRFYAMEALHGKYAAAAYFTLTHKGAIR